MEIKIFLMNTNQLVLVPKKHVGEVVTPLGIVEVEVDCGKNLEAGAENVVPSEQPQWKE